MDMALDTTFTSLPSTIKEQIFSSLKINERCLARGVCLSWAIFMNKYYGNNLVIDNENSNYILNIPKYGGEVKEVKLICLTRMVPDKISFSHLLNKIEFVKIVATYNVVKILNSFSSLEHLVFSKIIFQNDDDKELELLTPHAKLKSICIKLMKGQIFFTKHENQLFILLTYFNLNYLTTFIIKEEDYEISYFEREFSIEGRNDILSIIKVRLDQILPTVLENISKLIFQAKTNLTNLHLENIYEFGSEIQNIADIQLTQLTAVIYKMDGLVILSAQSILTKLHLRFNEKFWNEVKNCICKCEKTLKDVKLVASWDIENVLIEMNNSTMDLNFLNTIRNLTILHFEISARKIFDTFPSNVKSLFMNSPISREYVLKILSNPNSIANLKYFGLKYFGVHLPEIMNEESNGVIDIELFKLLINLPKIKKLVFIGCYMHKDVILTYYNDVPGIQIKSEISRIYQLVSQNIVNLEVSIDHHNFNPTEIM